MACVFCQSPDINHLEDALFECRSCGGMFIDYDLIPNNSPRYCKHEFINSGCARSWCKYCDVEGVFVFELGGYTTHENARILSRKTPEESD